MNISESSLETKRASSLKLVSVMVDDKVKEDNNINGITSDTRNNFIISINRFLSIGSKHNIGTCSMCDNRIFQMDKTKESMNIKEKRLLPCFFDTN
jgi:hypothetical protein